RPLLKKLAYASLVPFGRERVGMLLRAANDGAPAPDIVAELVQAFELASPTTLTYEDRRRSCSRRVRIVGDHVDAVALTGDVAAEVWLKAYVEPGRSVASIGRLLLAPGSKPPVGIKPRGRVVCNCVDVDEAAIVETIASAPSGMRGTNREDVLCT